MTWLAWMGVGMGFITAAVTPAFLRSVLKRLGVVDVPNDRSSHIRPTLRGGGVGPLLGSVFGGGVIAAGLAGSAQSAPFVAMILSGVAMGVVGAIEDLRGLNVAIRAASQVLFGIVSAVWLGVLFGASMWLVLIAIVMFVAYVNFANFMDGVNGISGLHGLVVGGAFAGVGAILEHSWLVAVGLLIAAVFAAFLPWNLLPPGMFLGDVGSYLLGALIAAAATAAAFAGAPLLTVLAPISIYLVDTLSVIIRRASRREAVLSAHRTHAYQRLTDTGFSHIQVSILVAVLSAGNAALGVVAMRGGAWFWASLVTISLVCALYILLPRLRGNRVPPRPARALGGIEPPAMIAPRAGFKPRRFAVVGATGFVGSALVTHLRSRKLDVVEVRAPRLRLSPQCYDPREVASEAAGHLRISELTDAIGQVDVVINAAGLATPDATPSEHLYGANALLPALVARAARAAGARRVIHLSSAAVQGRRTVLDESLEMSPFSPYSRSKALGERAFLAFGEIDSTLDQIVIRATSVQGPKRGTTESLRKIARSPFASVAGDGSRPTVVSSIDGLVDFVVSVSRSERQLGAVMLQPWEGFSAGDVLRLAGGREPLHLPVLICRVLLLGARMVGVFVPEVAGAGRRLELMWMGQQQASLFSDTFPPVAPVRLNRILEAGVRTENGSGVKT